MKSSKLTRIDLFPLVLIFVALTCAICVIGYRYYLVHKEKITHQKFQELSAIAGLKIEEIAKWRLQRLADAKSLQGNRHFVQHVALFLKNPDNRELREELFEWLSSFQTNFDYRNVALLDLNSVQQLIAGDQRVPDSTVFHELVLAAMRSGEVQFSDLHIGENFHIIHLDILVPLFLPRENDRVPVGVLRLVIDPSKRLYPLFFPGRHSAQAQRRCW